MATRPPDPVQAAVTDFAGPARGLSVLVVEDEPSIAMFLVRALGAEGHTVDVATSGSEVVGRTDLDGYDIVLLDMKMSGLGGSEVFDYIRQLPGDLAARVIFSTGDVANIETQEFIERTGNPVQALYARGADGYDSPLSGRVNGRLGPAVLESIGVPHTGIFERQRPRPSTGSISRSDSRPLRSR